MVLIVGAVLIALAVGLAAFLAATSGAESTGVARSLELVNYRPDSRSVTRSELSANERFAIPFESGMKSLARRLSPAGTAERLTLNLERAGNPSSWPLERLFAVKGIGLVGAAILGLLVGGVGFRGIIYAFVGAAAFFWLPDLLVYNAGLKRQEELRKGFADALDMLTVCVEAGQGFDAALAQVARTVTGPISGEFARVLSEVQIGMSRADAFAALGARNSAPEIRNFVTAFVQADRLGVPIGGVLREQTREMRLVRRQRAEEQAQKMTIKVLFPVLFCIFPVMFIVILGPAAINFMTYFSQMGL